MRRALYAGDLSPRLQHRRHQRLVRSLRVDAQQGLGAAGAYQQPAAFKLEAVAVQRVALEQLAPGDRVRSGRDDALEDRITLAGLQMNVDAVVEVLAGLRVQL